MDKMKKVSFIAIGDELLSGKVVDLNGGWLAKFCFRHNLHFTGMSFVPDQAQEIKDSLTNALLKNDIVITSGGVGPTKDDITKDVLADFFKQEMHESEDAIAVAKANYKRLNREWSKTSNQYHLFPKNFLPINNPMGFAPGIHYKHEGKLIFSGPGVPHEFSAMVEKEFYSIIKKEFFSTTSNFQITIKTYGIPEEKIFFELCPTLWSDLEHFGKVSSLPQNVGVNIVVSFSGDQKKYDETLIKIKKIIENSPLMPNVWHWGEETAVELCLDLAIKNNLTFSFAESCTGGLCSSRITDLSGSSKVFLGSVISYDNSVKENIINVKKETLTKFGAVSIETAKEMANGVRAKILTDIALSLTGIAGPTGGSEQKPVGTVAIGIDSKLGNSAELFHFRGDDRLKLKNRFSDMGYLVLLKEMRKIISSQQS